MYVYFYSLHVSGNHVPIIRRINCVNAIPGICHSVWTTVWYAYQTVVHTEWHIPGIALIQDARSTKHNKMGHVVRMG